MLDARILIRADNAAVAIERGLIVEPTGRFDLELRLPGRIIRPGLINAHDHLHRNHYGRLGSPPYRNAYAWGRDIQRRCQDRIAAGRRMERRAALLTGAWKNLFSGVTSVVHHDRWERDFEHDFPLRVVPIASANALGFAVSAGSSAEAWCLHLAEGTDRAAASEVHELHARGLLDRHLLAVHGVGMDAGGVALFRASGAALVWCPTSNLFLLGRTAPAELLAEGIDVLLGSDSLLSGQGNLLDELHAARRLGLLSDRRLEAAVGGVAARRLRIAAPSLEAGSRADLVVFAKPLLEASAADVELVIAAGVPRVATPELGAQFASLGLAGRAMTIGGVSRWANGAPYRDHGDEPNAVLDATIEATLRGTGRTRDDFILQRT